MATTFSQTKTALDEISQRINTNRNRIAQARQTIGTAEADLNSLASQYSEIISDLAATAEANPKNAAIQSAKAEADLLVAEFGVLKAEATAKKTAYDGV